MLQPSKIKWIKENPNTLLVQCLNMSLKVKRVHLDEKTWVTKSFPNQTQNYIQKSLENSIEKQLKRMPRHNPVGFSARFKVVDNPNFFFFFPCLLAGYTAGYENQFFKFFVKLFVWLKTNTYAKK